MATTLATNASTPSRRWPLSSWVWMENPWLPGPRWTGARYRQPGESISFFIVDKWLGPGIDRIVDAARVSACATL